jgi:predicted nucleotidyltransferase/DNA-binding HxlR family transcriptional regulator
MRAIRTLGDLLFGKGRGAILGLLYGHPDQSFYYRQITRQVHGVSAGTLQRELDTLTQAGLIARSSVGNQVFYQANRNSPIFGELRAILSKTVGVFHLLRSALEPLEDRIVAAFVYGSVAKQQETAESDVDVMVVGRVDLDDVLEHLATVETQLARPINPTVYSISEFVSKLTAGNHFVTSVVRGPKIFLIGDEDELGRIGRKQTIKSRTDQRR